MNTVQVDPHWSCLDLSVICWRMTLHTHTNTHKRLLSCRRIPLLLYPVLDDKNKTTTDRITMKQVAIYVLHWKSYWYNDYSILYVRGASDKLTNWLVSRSVSWPNRKPAVPFCHWFLPPDVPAQEAELALPPFQEHTGLAGLHLRGGNWRVKSHEFSRWTYQPPYHKHCTDLVRQSLTQVSHTGKLANFHVYHESSAPKTADYIKTKTDRKPQFTDSMSDELIEKQRSCDDTILKIKAHV